CRKGRPLRQDKPKSRRRHRSAKNALAFSIQSVISSPDGPPELIQLPSTKPCPTTPSVQSRRLAVWTGQLVC
ncbi:hypothetical protein T265_06672, partial [Opisthorchis viverrini]